MAIILGSKPGGSGGGAPSGAAGGDLGGTYPNPTIAPNSVAAAEIDGTDAAAIRTELDVPSNAQVVLELAYAQYTSNVACTAISAATANTIVTAGAVTGDAVTVMLIEYFCSGWTASTTANTCHIELYDGAGDAHQLFNARAANTTINQSIYTAVRITPTAASHTFSIRGWIDTSGTFTVVGGAGGAATPVPGFIRISRVAA